MATLKDYTNLKGLNLDWNKDTKNVTVGDKMYTPTQLTNAGLTLNQGRWQGEDNALKTLFDNNQTVVPTPPTNISSTVSTNQPTTPKPTNDLSTMITNQISALSDAQIANLRAKIASATSAQKDIITNAPAQFAPLVDQSEVQKASELRSQLERNANLGDRGGIGRQATLETQLAGSKRLNDLNIAEQKVISDANAEIARLQSQGAFEEANILATNKAEELRLLREQAMRQEDLTREDQLRAETLARQDKETQTAQEKSDFATKLASKYLNISQFVNELKASGAPQWQIDMAEAERVNKIIENNLDPSTGKPIAQDNTQAIWDNALTKWNAGIPLTQEEMQVIGATTPTKPKAVSSGGGTTVTQNRNYAFDKWEALGKADAEIAQILGIPVGTKWTSNAKTTTSTGTQTVDTKPYKDYIETYLTSQNDITGRKEINTNDAAMYLARLAMQDPSFEPTAYQLMQEYNIPIESVDIAEKILRGNTLDIRQ